MVNQTANYYGALLLVLIAAVWVGIFTSEPSITGFAVKEIEFSEFDVKLYGDEQQVCADGSFYQECSSLIKGKFCHLGKLTDYCELCGCDDDEICSNRKCVKEK